jgi:hypothetical protein
MTKEEALAIRAQSQAQLDAAYADLLAARKPDTRLTGYRSASQLRRSAARLRAGKIVPGDPDEAPEDLAREYDYAAEYDLKVRTVERLAKEHQGLTKTLGRTLAQEVRETFRYLKVWKNDPSIEPVVRANIAELDRELRRNAGRARHKGRRELTER